MKVAIVSRFGHMECVGFLLEILYRIHGRTDSNKKQTNATVCIDAAFNTDKFNWIAFYKTIYDFEVLPTVTISTANYDHTIKLTSHDQCLYTEENTISIVHLKSEAYYNNRSRAFLSLTPYISGDRIHYLFPNKIQS